MQNPTSKLLWAALIVLSVLVKAGIVQMTPAVGWGMLGISISFVAYVYYTLGPGHQYREYLYDPLDSDHLPSESRDAFQKYTPYFTELGFEWVEDTRLQTAPYRHDVRIFLNPRGDIWGEMNVVIVPLLTIAELVSVYDDGMLLVTSSAESGDLPERQDRMLWNCRPKETIEELFHHHLEAMESYQAETRAEALAFSPADFEEVITYGHRLNWHWRRRQGLTNHPVPEPELPRGSRPCGLSVVRS